MTHGKWIGFRLAALAIGLTAAIVLGEIAVRALGVAPRYNVVYRENFRRSENPILRWELVPGSADGPSRISLAGLRDREFAVPKPPNVFRILIIGDSVTSAHYCRQERTYPKQLEAFLNAYATPGGPNFEVLNLGVVGYNATQAVEALRARGFRFEPDLVVYGYVLNDPLATHLIGEKLDAMGREATGANTRGASRLLRSLRLYQLIRSRLVRPPSDAAVDWTAPVYEAAESGGQASVLRTLHASGSETWARVDDAFDALSRLRAASGNWPALVAIFPVASSAPDAPYELGDVHALVAASAERHTLHALDLAPAFVEAQRRFGANLFGDLMHPNENGLRLAAMAILHELCGMEGFPGGAELWQRIREGGGKDAALASVAER